MDWYTVNTKPRQESLAEQSLRRLGVQTLCPKLKQTKLIRRRWTTTIGPLFPGYLFARMDLATHCRAVDYSPGVRRMVYFGKNPATVEEGIIESIQSRIEGGFVHIQPRLLKRGQTVRIQQGPLMGLEAVFEQELNDQQRVLLLLKSLSYQARIVVPSEYVIDLHTAG